MGLRDGGAVERPPVPLVAPSLQGMAEELGILLDDDKSGYDLDVDMESSPWGLRLGGS